jgi:hypothetical protein
MTPDSDTNNIDRDNTNYSDSSSDEDLDTVDYQKDNTEDDE